jgi:hypothetical protein
MAGGAGAIGSSSSSRFVAQARVRLALIEFMPRPITRRLLDLLLHWTLFLQQLHL